MAFKESKYGPSDRNNSITMARNSMGEYGKEVINGDPPTNTTSEDTIFRQLMIIEDVELTDITDAECAGDGIELLIGVAIPAGMIIYGKFSNITISSGVMICYKEKP